MRLNAPLDALFSSPIKVRTLRHLIVHPAEISGRALARQIDACPAQVHRVLQELYLEGVVSLKQIGRAHVFSLRRETALAQELLIPLFQRERTIRDVVLKKIVREVKTSTLSIFVFGSVARGESEGGSDLDLAFVAENPAKKRALEHELTSSVADSAAKLGVRLSPYVVTRAELVKKYKERDRFVLEILGTGFRVAGQVPLDLASDAPKK